MSRLISEKADAINLAGVHIYSFAHGFAESRIFPRSKPSFKNGPTKCRQAIYAMSFWVESSSRAPAIVYCASVSPNVRCVSANVRQTAASVSDNVRRKSPSIARRAVHYCAPLHLEVGDRHLHADLQHVAADYSRTTFDHGTALRGRDLGLREQPPGARAPRPSQLAGRSECKAGPGSKAASQLYSRSTESGLELEKFSIVLARSLRIRNPPRDSASPATIPRSGGRPSVRFSSKYLRSRKICS